MWLWVPVTPLQGLMAGATLQSAHSPDVQGANDARV